MSTSPVAGSGASAVADAASKPLRAKVLVADDAAYAHGLSEPLADLIVSPVPRYRHRRQPRLPACCCAWPRFLDVMQVSEIVEACSADIVQASDLCGNAIQTVQSTGREESDYRACISFAAAPAGGPAAIGLCCQRWRQGH